MRNVFQTAWRWLRERWQWFVGGLFVAFALYGKRVAENREKAARDRLTDVSETRLNDIFDEQDSRTTDYLNAQQSNKSAAKRLNRRLDEIAKDESDTARVISDWNLDNARERLRDGKNAS